MDESRRGEEKGRRRETGHSREIAGILARIIQPNPAA
jgi:hypothetical protein